MSEPRRHMHRDTAHLADDPHGLIAITKGYFKLSLIVALVVVSFALGWRLGA